MIPSKYHPELQIDVCPNCNSSDVEESGDDYDGMVNCNYCSLSTPTFTGTKSAINAWNKRAYKDKWYFLDEENVVQGRYQI